MVELEQYQQALPAALRELVFAPGRPGYANATTPRNATAHQSPAAVFKATAPHQVAAAVRAAAEVGARVAPQSTGHGAAGSLGDDVILIDTSRLNTVDIDVERRVVRTGAGATFGEINERAFRAGLLAAAGTAPDVAAAGYTVLGGVGWLTRPHGLASASLRVVELVDASGRTVRADDRQNEELLWVSRGGGGAGILTSLELALFPARDLWAGYALWSVDAADELLPAWGEALASFDPALSSAIGVLHAPDAGSVPAELRGSTVVHLSAATSVGSRAAQSLREFLDRVPRPAMSTFGPADSARLSSIHLDPPDPVPALGEGRWLTAAAANHVPDILTAAGTRADGPLAEVELRHVAVPPSPVSGAMTTPPGDLLLHATGPVPTSDRRDAVLEALDSVHAKAQPVDAGFSATAFRDGRPAGPDALPPDVHARSEQIRRSVDPDRVIIGTRTDR